MALPLSSIQAAIDVGSNSVHLLVVSVQTGVMSPLADESVQLGTGDVVDREGRITEPMRDALLDVLELYAHRAEALGARSTLLLGTEPLRRASNRSVIQAEILRATGQPLQILSHSAEAELTLLGVTGGQPPDSPLLVVDIGGGSTEIVLAAPGRDPVVGSMPVGSARLKQAFVTNDPPTWFEINALRAEAARLAQALPERDHSLTIDRAVGVGGSVTNLRRFVPDGGQLDRDAIASALGVLARVPAQQIAVDYGVSVRRAQQLPPGAALLEAILDRYEVVSIEPSDASLREGAILAAMRGGEHWLEHLPEMLR